MNMSDKQIEALLRRHARLSKAGSAVAGFAHLQPARAAAAAPHLDADELNAFAAGALSDEARARYAAHLADCDRCRALTIQLTLAAGAAHERWGAAKLKSSWLGKIREIVASLLAPQGWRYVAPALALIAVASVTFVALRHQRKTELVAQNSPLSEGRQVQSAAPGVAEIREESYTQSAERARPSKEQAKPGGTGSAKPKGAAEREAASATSATPEKQGAVAENNPREFSPPPPEERAAKPEEQETKKSATEPAAAPKTEPSTEQTTATQRKQADESAKEGERAGANKEATERDKTTEPAPRAAMTGTAKRRAGIAGGVMLPQSVEKTTAASESSTETRKVGGHVFRRQGSAWVDTAYTSSMSLVNIARGSDEYLSLIENDSSLRKIVEQLSGEVIVVWKSKAYRVR